MNRIISVAPMMDCTDRHERYFLRLISKNVLLYTEMIVSEAIDRGDKKKLLSFNTNEKPVGLQLGGSSPEEGSCQLRIDGNKSNGANFYRVDGATTDAYYASFVRYANGSSTYFDVLAYQNVGSGSVTATAGTSSNFYGWRIA